ncbi:hypothetical protein pipiens_004741 [Culex pipiens pipiens]|uniref:Uncharacterized protein n=1 Tax=Culex pipiens pipiens TaxID=38569 RepID=A0ABD1CFJ2_CULPP
MCDDTKGQVYPSAIPYTVPLPKQNNDQDHFDKLRDPTVMENIRLYLAYLKDAPPAVSFKGKTNTSVRLFLAGEGIPTYPGTLLRIFVAYHVSLGSTSTSALADLETLSRYVAAKRTKELQEARETPTMCDDTKGQVYPSVIPYTVPLPKQNNDHEHFDKLRDPIVMENVRLYLAYLKDAPPAVSFKGKTNTSVQLFLAGEGIPTYPGTLLRIFVAYHVSLGSTKTSALADLETLSRYVAAKRTKELQEARESHQKFYYS